MKQITFTIDNTECAAHEGMSITEAARQNGVFIPTLCDFEGHAPAGTCRVCTVKINGRFCAACSTKAEQGMTVENETDELTDIRKAIIEMLFVEGNHQCSICEKSGNCSLQALAYRYRMMVPRFPFQFPVRAIDNPGSKIHIDTNRCIQCMRCVRGVLIDGKHLFKMKRGHDRNLRLSLNEELTDMITEDTVRETMDICPVGAILSGKDAYRTPIGKRKFDEAPIGI